GLGEAPLVRITEEETGRVHRWVTLRLGRWELHLGGREPPFTAVRWEERTVSPRYVPGVSWTWHVGHEVERRTEPQDPAAARQEAVERAREQVLAQLPAAADVLEEQMSVADDPAAGVVRATVTLEVLQDLG